jgi:hypothetical protein
MSFGSLSVDKITDSEGSVFSPSSALFRNRIINGDMRIDQRNAGANVTPTNGQYTLDRWSASQPAASKFSVQQNAGSVTPPASFEYYLGVTSLSAYTVGASEAFSVQQRIEGFNVADLGWGTANAKTVTLSFWVRSSLTGTFGGSFRNSAVNRSYPFTYSISVAETWEYKTVTVEGDTSGTWLKTNGNGINVAFALGAGASVSGTAGAWNSNNNSSATGAVSVVGTNGATFYITGVQLEVGSVATPFERRPYGTELMLCQRYYYRVNGTESGDRFAMAFNDSTTIATSLFHFPVTMRAKPTALEQSGTASDYSIAHQTTATTCSSVPSLSNALFNTSTVSLQVSSGLTAGQASQARAATTSAFFAWSAEL